METLNANWLRAKHAVFGYGEKRITVEPLDFVLPSGKVAVLLGRNGSGKTTLIRALLGERTLLSGDIFLWNDDTPIADWPSSKRAGKIGYVPQEPVFPVELRLRDLLSLAFLPELGLFRSLGEDHRTRIERMARELDLARLIDRPMKTLSTGEKQRAFLARALLQSPKALLLDEPTNHLDPTARAEFWDALAACPNCEVLLSTHDLGFARKRAEWICALKDGRIFFNGPAKDFWQNDGVKNVFGRSDIE